MKSTQKSLVCLLILCGSGLIAQDFKFGNVSAEELLEKVYPSDSSAPAAILYRDVSIRYEYMPSDGFHIITHVHQRIKIYDTRGFEYATIRENLYKNGGDKEILSNLKGYTYNYENGQVVKSRVKGSDTFATSLNDYYNEELFTMPDIKAGSVIEYEYRLDSPFSNSIDEIRLQENIPIKTQEIKITIPEYYFFKPLVKGYLPIQPEFSSSSGKISMMSQGGQIQGFVNNAKMNNNTLDYRQTTTLYKMKDVPALKEEPYVNSMNNYRSALNYELMYVQFPQAAREDFTNSWENVVQRIYESPRFGGQLSNTRFLQEHLRALLPPEVDNLQKATLIFDHVQDRMVWNGIWGYFTDKGVKKAYEERSGNTADINLILISMLREAGLNANPVLLSTRDNGVPLFPTREGFNYVVASVDLNGEVLFLDASDKLTCPGLLPVQALNWFGKIIREDGSFETVSMVPEEVSKEISMLNVSLDAEGRLEGKIRRTYTDHRGYGFRSKTSGLSETQYLDQLAAKNQDMEIRNYSLNNKNNTEKPLIEEFEFTIENPAGVLSEKLYFTPVLIDALTENPFRLEERNYPVDFGYGWQEKYVLTLSLPPGYEVISLPAPLNLALADKQGTFTYKIMQLENGQLQVLTELSMNEAVIPAQSYSALKELYKKVVEKVAEKVVLSKISEDEITERAAGGR